MRCRRHDCVAAFVVLWGFSGLFFSAGSGAIAASVEPAFHEVGFGKVDITPDYHIRLSGFASRKTESVGVRSHIFARAMAIRANNGGEPVVLVTVDSIGVPRYVRDEVAKRLSAKKQIKNERFALCSTHSHTTPAIAKVLPTLFGEPVPADQEKRIERYTAELTDGIERAAISALDDLKPGLISYGIGSIGFSINRRTRGGPVDHNVPVMVVKAPGGKVRGVWVSYACHCVVLSDFNVSGDWAGYAAAALEKKFSEAVALVSIGCGADSNPQSGVTGDKGDVAQQYGQEVATEVERVLSGQLTRVSDDVECKLDIVSLPLAKLPSREEWENRAKNSDFDGYYAKVQLARLDAGEKLQTDVPYIVQTWKFGKTLATVFLSGEVVVDYSLRLKKELDGARLWMNAYSNDVPCYIPSERVLKEGGYEGGGAMIFYGVPAPFAPGLEEKIISTVREQLGDDFKAAAKQPGTQGSLPKSSVESLSAIKVHDGLRVELVASEPMVQSPVAIDFGPDGKVWVAEMRDYGCKDGETRPPDGRVSVLEDRDRDGTFETATVFLDKIALPMGVTAWKKGVLISAAPDLIYAEDTDGDGRADRIEKTFTGFSVENPQARLNTLCVGLDGGFEGGCMFVGKVRNATGREFEIGNRDFRMRPESGEIESENGQTENARVRDDWGNWFGCENSNLCLHYPLADRYLRRNAALVPPPLTVTVPRPAAAKLIPRGKIVLLPLSGPGGRATAACGLTFYRDELLGPQFSGNAFTCEPVHQLVHRLVLSGKGATFVGERAAEETESEFLSSTDNWFRPVQARTGPDGALWIVDMYRYVIEHSRWIPADVQAELDVYAGSSLGRIYRVLPANAKHRALPQLNNLATEELAAAMDSPNGTLRDMVQQQIVWRGDEKAVAPLVEVAANGRVPAGRMQALCTLAILGKLGDAQIARALGDAHAGVRRQAVRLSESRLKSSPTLLEAVLKLAGDADLFVASQVACSLGETDDPRKVAAIAAILRRHSADAYIATGALSSVKAGELDALLGSVLAGDVVLSPKFVTQLLELVGASTNEKAVSSAVRFIGSKSGAEDSVLLDRLSALVSGLRRNPRMAEALSKDANSQLEGLRTRCMRIATEESADVRMRAKGIRVVGKMPGLREAELELLKNFLGAENDSSLQLAAIDALAERRRNDLARLLLGGWQTFTPALRAHVLDVLLTRKPWVAALLGAIDGRSIAVMEIDAAHRSRLIEYPDDELRAKAAEIFSRTSNGTRGEVVARYAALVKDGDAARGKSVFEKNCAACHKAHNVGSQVGPDIAAREDKSREGLLREVLDPNRAVDQRFAEYVAVTSDGLVKNGILVEESGGAITLRGQQGVETKLLRSELESLKSSGKSLMPEGFENQITPEGMSDLLAFLAGP